MLAALIAAEGYRADIVLIGEGARFNPDVPMPAAFNHAIVATSAGTGALQSTTWLDPTLEVAPYGALQSIERDKPVLRIPASNPATLDRTPADLPFASFQRFEVTGSLNKSGLAKGHFIDTFRGDDEITLRAAIRQVSPGQYDQAAQYLMGVWGFGGTVSHASFSPPTQTEKPFEMTFDYERDKPGSDWDNYRIVMLDGPDELPVIDEKQPPKLPIQFGTPQTITSNTQLALPTGWGATRPDPVHQKTPWVTLDRVYRVEKASLIEERTIAILKKEIPAASWREYKLFADAVSAGSYPYVQLTRDATKGSTVGTPGPPPPTHTVEAAATLLNEARQALHDHDLILSDNFIAQAKALNPGEPYLWGLAGDVAFARGETGESIVDYQKEIVLHPNEPNVYRALAFSQMAEGQRADAEATLGRRLKTIGPDATTSIQLAQMLTEDEKPREALQVAEQASQADGGNLRLQLLLGREQVKAGEQQKGFSTLSAALTKAQEPSLRNDIAYELADAGDATAEVEAAARGVVDQLAAESSTWTLTDPTQEISEMKARSALQIAAWDTLAWTIYKSLTGHELQRLAKAEQYSATAWRDEPRGEIGLHLGEIEEASAHPERALVDYQLAAAALPTTDMRGVRVPPTPMLLDLNARISRLKKAQPHSALQNPIEALQAQRKMPAGDSGGRVAVRPYRILVTSSGLEATVALGNAQKATDTTDDHVTIERILPKDWVPKRSQARLLRSVVLNCHQAVCEVITSPVSATR